MKLFHVTAKGNLHFQLSDGRLAAVYPETGYVRVSGSFKFFIRPEFEERRRQFYDEVVEAKTPGKVAMWPINKRSIVTTKVAVNKDLYYRARWNGELYKYPQDVFYEMESSKCELFPGDIVKLMDLLVAFENKNCANSHLHLNCFYKGLEKKGRVTINKWPC